VPKTKKDMNHAIGQRVRALRARHRWTLSALGRRIGLSASQLSQIERGKSEISVSLVRDVALAFGVAIGWLIVGNVEDQVYEDELVTRAMKDPEFRTVVERLAGSKYGQGDWGVCPFIYEATAHMVDQ